LINLDSIPYIVPIVQFTSAHNFRPFIKYLSAFLSFGGLFIQKSLCVTGLSFRIDRVIWLRRLCSENCDSNYIWHRFEWFITLVFV